MGRKKRGIFSTIVTSYVLFSFLLVVSLIAAILIGGSLLIMGSKPIVNPYEAMDDTDSVLYKIGGWTEVLDAGRNVIQVKGEKKDDVTHYTFAELIELEDMSSEKGYTAFIENYGDGYRLFKIANDGLLSTNYTIEISNKHPAGNTNTIIGISFLVFYVVNIGLISFYLKQKISKPMTVLKQGILAVNKGEETIIPTSKGPKEFVEIHQSFNDMVEELKRSRQEKQAMENSRTRMLLNLSHDIKTPISTIKLYAKALRDKLVTGQKADDYLWTIDAKATRVAELSDDMFTLLKLEDSDYQISLKKEDAGEMVREVCAEYYDEVIEAGLTLELAIPDSFVAVQADKKLFRRVIANLLSNAVKYNTTGQLIVVSVKQLSGRRTVITVSDDGEPITAETRNDLFSAFTRGDAARSSSGGTGLGLSIAKGIIEKHAGELHYKREQQLNTFEIII